MVEIFLIIVFAAFALFFAIKTYSFSKDITALQTALVESYIKNKNEEDLVNEQFLKFVSDSREWAFDYIESVQGSIEDIVNFMKPVVINRDNREYNDRDVLESVYKSLKKLLPEQDN